MTGVDEVIAEIKKRFEGVPGVIGVGGTKGSPQRVVVYVEEITPDIKAKVPPVIAGYGVTIEQAHDLSAL